MPLPLPSLDDRRWQDLVDEGRALIPLHAPGWTDHNVHDVGITFMELLAAITEADLFRIDLVGDEHRRKFLALVGVRPRPPRGTRAVVSIRAAAGAFDLPSGFEFGSTRRQFRYRMEHGLTVVAGGLDAVWTQAGGVTRDLTADLKRGTSIAPFGNDPEPGAALVLGMAPPDPAGKTLSVQFVVTDERTGEREALRDPAEPLLHHDARVAWEVRTGPSTWRELADDDVRDGTRAFTLSGRVQVHMPADMVQDTFADDDRNLYLLRCRLVSGRYDDAPRLATIAWNGVIVRQEVPTGSDWVLAAGAGVQGPVPTAGEPVQFTAVFDAAGRISDIEFDAADAPAFLALDYEAPQPGTEGRLSLEATVAGKGNGKPGQEVALAEPLVADSSLVLHTLEEANWVRWEARPDFTASEPADTHYVPDPTTGAVRFGDGASGRAVPSGARIVVAYDTTHGEAGNVDRGTIDTVAASAHNLAAVVDLDATRGNIGKVEQPLPAAHGSDAESLEAAAARAVELVEASGRAVTLDDFRTLALAAPGTRVARVEAWANTHPAFPCLKAPGIVTLVVLPFLPRERPQPTPALRRRVLSHLVPRTILGTRLEVVGPEYVEVRVCAQVQACAGVSTAGLAERIRERLDAFFHPLHGGEAGEGWPFGRDVYRSEVLQVIDETPGVEHVLTLELITGDCDATCANVCVPLAGLIAAGNHTIEVTR